MSTASADTIWSFFQNVPAWKEWNAGVRECTIDGPFADGSWLTMTLPEGDVLKSKLIDVRAPHTFTDETVLGDITVRVTHTIAALPNGANQITYSVDVSGENAPDVCAGVSADFPAVLAVLAERAEQVATR